MGESEKLKKGWKYGGGADPLKKGEKGQGALLLFSFFKVYYFCILKLFYSLQHSVKHLNKNHLFLPT